MNNINGVPQEIPGDISEKQAFGLMLLQGLAEQNAERQKLGMPLDWMPVANPLGRAMFKIPGVSTTRKYMSMKGAGLLARFLTEEEKVAEAAAEAAKKAKQLERAAAIVECEQVGIRRIEDGRKAIDAFKAKYAKAAGASVPKGAKNKVHH